MTADDFLIHELAKMAGVSVRTIRYYIDKGLLPAPETKGRYATYNQEYLDRLELILRLKDAFLPLKEIRQQIANLNAKDVRDLLVKMDEERTTAKQPPSQLRESKPVSNALEYINQVMETQNKIVLPSRRQRQTSPPFVAQTPDKSLPRPLSDSQPEAYQRFIVAPGIELHIHQALASQHTNRIQRLLEFAKTLFEHT
jgi:DNA-binding transcriptional MerR regulator